MKKQIIITAILALIVLLPIVAQEKEAKDQAPMQKGQRIYAIAFYNLENLFDTKDDPDTNDEDFLPNGSYGWDENKYHKKLNNMSRVLADIATDLKLKSGDAACKFGASVIGISEVENARVVNDLCDVLHSRRIEKAIEDSISTKRFTKNDRDSLHHIISQKFKKHRYRYLHVDSPDARGIDCALLYDPSAFTLQDSLYIHNITPEQGSDDWLGFTQDSITKVITPRELFGDTSHKTRGFLVGIGTMAGEKIAFIVNHWPSRGAESYVRERAGRQVKKLIEALQIQYPGIKVISMGDLNDDPDNKSMSKSMQCKYFPKDVKSDGDIFNPWKYMLRNIGQGTLLYDGKWNLFDQIIMTGNLVDRKMWLGKKRPDPRDINLSNGLTFYYNRVVNLDYMVAKDGRYKGAPRRTTSSGVWLEDGFSDHFPTCIYLLK